ncbi:hypothetical protein HJG60_010782 [Phyllostomus discolor]|uniref:Uncharacterized protein n=1 Tax=Phyllostomus discolor TaxID=89673 RepID=A0A834ABU9_9CHIR|nr:hypothetical protein HJG60_010782 [Phyllostomus discolor]
MALRRLRRQGDGRWQQRCSGYMWDPSGCPRRAGAPSLPHPKRKLARTGTKATACNMRVAGTRHCHREADSYPEGCGWAWPWDSRCCIRELSLSSPVSKYSMSPCWVPGPYPRSPPVCPNLALSWGRTKGSLPPTPAPCTGRSENSGGVRLSHPPRQPILSADCRPCRARRPLAAGNQAYSGPSCSLGTEAWSPLSRDHHNPLPLPFSPAPGPSAAVEKTSNTHPSSEVKGNRVHLDLKRQFPHPTTTSTLSCPPPLALSYHPEGQITPAFSAVTHVSPDAICPHPCGKQRLSLENPARPS